MNSDTQRRIDYDPCAYHVRCIFSPAVRYAPMKKKQSKIRVCGIWYEIVSMSEEDEPQLEGAEGLCDHKNCRIVLKTGIDQNRVKDTLVHEILHALINESGVRNELETLAHKDAGEVEERIVRMLTPHLCDLLEQLK